jgi:hypothetical protein
MGPIEELHELNEAGKSAEVIQRAQEHLRLVSQVPSSLDHAAYFAHIFYQLGVAHADMRQPQFAYQAFEHALVYTADSRLQATERQTIAAALLDILSRLPQDAAVKKRRKQIEDYLVWLKDFYLSRY